MNETNFKVGDRVIGISNKIGYKIKNVKGTVIYANYNSTCVEFDEYVNGHSGGVDGLNGKLGHCVYVGTNVRLLNESPIEEEMGNEVIATQKRDGKFVDSAKAKCISTDEFVFLKGAEIAFDRLTDSEVKEVERVAELGEYIRVMSTDGNGLEKDSIHKVTGYGRTGFPEWVYVDVMNRGIIRINQYVVLENYQPQQQIESQAQEIMKLKKQIEKQKELIIEKNEIIKSLNNTQHKKTKELIESECPVRNGFNEEYCGDMTCKECWLKAIETEILDEEE